MIALAIIIAALVWFAASASIAKRGWLPRWAAYPLLGLLALGVLDMTDLGPRGIGFVDGWGPLLAILCCVLFVYNLGMNARPPSVR